jgi:cell division protein FtsW (lipid II flippase)
MKKTFAWLRDYFRRADMPLLFLCIICAVFGIVVISSAVQTYGNPAKYVVVQTLALGIGIVLYIVMTVIDIDILADKWVLLCVFNVLFLGTLIFFGQESETGNSGWLRFFGIGIQPSEVVKITYIIIMAKHISYLKEYKDLNSVVSVAQLAVHFIAIFGLLLFTSKDLGSALVYFFIFAIMLFAGGLKLYWFAIGLAAIAAVTRSSGTTFLRIIKKRGSSRRTIPHRRPHRVRRDLACQPVEARPRLRAADGNGAGERHPEPVGRDLRQTFGLYLCGHR